MAKRVLLLAAVLLVSMVGTAHAQDPTTYPQTVLTVTVNNPLIPGGSIIVEVKLFKSGAPVTVSIDGAGLGQANANGSGVARYVGIVPLGLAPGSHELTASGVGTDGKLHTVTRTITIQSAGDAEVAGIQVQRPAATKVLLARDGGSDSSRAIPLAVGGALGVGLLALAATKRRSNKVDAEV